MDNLDRTNVAQSAIARWMLDRQLRDLGLLQENESVEGQPEFMHHFRHRAPHLLSPDLLITLND